MQNGQTIFLSFCLLAIVYLFHTCLTCGYFLTLGPWIPAYLTFHRHMGYIALSHEQLSCMYQNYMIRSITILIYIANRNTHTRIYKPFKEENFEFTFSWISFNLVVIILGDAKVIMPGDAKVIIPGNAKVIIPGNAKVIIPGGVKVIIPGNAKVFIPGDANLS